MVTSNFKFKLALHKSYFDKGMAITSYAKYLIAFFGIATQNLNQIMTIAFIYAVFCYFLGWVWFRFGWVTAEMEVGNQYNLFVKEMRKVYK